MPPLRRPIRSAHPRHRSRPSSAVPTSSCGIRRPVRTCARTSSRSLSGGHVIPSSASGGPPSRLRTGPSSTPYGGAVAERRSVVRQRRPYPKFGVYRPRVQALLIAVHPHRPLAHRHRQAGPPFTSTATTPAWRLGTRRSPRAIGPPGPPTAGSSAHRRCHRRRSPKHPRGVRLGGERERVAEGVDRRRGVVLGDAGFFGRVRQRGRRSRRSV